MSGSMQNASMALAGARPSGPSSAVGTTSAALPVPAAAARGLPARRALALLRSGRLEHLGDEAVRLLQDRLRSLPAFHSLQQVVRVDPQIMLVLNTDAMRFEDPKSDALGGETGPDGLPVDGVQEREAVERAFWDACTLELTNAPPVYERTLQLVQEVRDTLCSLMPPVGTPTLRTSGNRPTVPPMPSTR